MGNRQFKQVDYYRLIEIVCEMFGITINEYLSTFNYGNIATARRAVIFILHRLGLPNKQIIEMTGYSGSRVSTYIKTAGLKQDQINKILNRYGSTE